MVVFRNKSVKWHLETNKRGNFKLLWYISFFVYVSFYFSAYFPLAWIFILYFTPPPSPIPFLMVHLNLRAEPPNLLSDAKWSSERMNSSAAERVHGLSLSFIQWRIQGRSPGDLTPPLIFRPKWGPKGRKNFLGDRPPSLSQGLDSGTVIYHPNSLRHLCCHSS